MYKPAGLGKKLNRQKYRSKLSPITAINCSLWKAIKRLKQFAYQEGRWKLGSEEEKAEIFATHLSKVLKPNSRLYLKSKINCSLITLLDI